MKKLLQTLFFFLLVTQISFAQWYQQSSGTTKNLNGTYFTNADIGFAVGDSGTILRTTNGGTLWTSQTSGTSQSLEKVQFIDTNVGWVVGDSGTILKTNNGGIDWINQISGTSVDLNSIHFINLNNGWAVGGNYWYDSTYTYHTNGITLHTTDGGINWITLNTDSMIILRSIYFLNADTGFAVGGATILHTTNGGISWDTTIIYPTDTEGIGIPGSQSNKLESPNCLSHSDLNFVQFSDKQTGWIVGWNPCPGPEGPAAGIILKTNNGGLTWSRVTFKSSINIISSICFVDSLTGWVAGSFNYFDYFATAICFTTDGGDSWDDQFLEEGSTLNDIYFADQMNGWAVGAGGTILHTTNGGVTFIDEEQTNAMPIEFLLSQNYPNPFNPSTTIRFEIPKQSHVTLTIYDILGWEIATLVNETRDAGAYNTVWNAEDKSSGIYFYRLKAGEYEETKKLILLR